MRIAVLEPYISGIGGAQRMIAKYCYYLKSKGHKVTIFTTRHDKSPYEDFKKLDIKVIGSKYKIFSPFIFLRKFGGFDAIIANDWPTNFASILNKNVLWMCYTPKRDFYDLSGWTFKNSSISGKIGLIFKIAAFKCLDRLSAKKANKIVAISKNVWKRIRMYYKRDAEIFYPGIEFKKYKSGKLGDYALVVSRFVKPKRVEEVILSSDFLKNKKLKIYAVGDGQDKDRIKNLAEKRKNVVIIENASDKKLSELYSKCLCVVYVPINEDWGLIPLEAAAASKPIIGSNEGGLKETIVNNRTGFLIDEITPKAIAGKINFLDSNRKTASKMGAEGKKECLRFDWKNSLPDLEKMLHELA